MKYDLITTREGGFLAKVSYIRCVLLTGVVVVAGKQFDKMSPHITLSWNCQKHDNIDNTEAEDGFIYLQ